MKVIPTPQSSTAISVTWEYDTNAGDVIPDISVTINEYGPDGKLMDSKSNLAVLTGVALFERLKPSTTYKYQWCGVFSDLGAGGSQTSCQDPRDAAAATTLLPPGPPVPGPPGPPRPGPPGPLPTFGVTVQAQALPFQKIGITWGPTGAAGLMSIVRLRNHFGAGELPLSPGKDYTSGFNLDTGPFDKSAVYSYQAGLLSQGVAGAAFSNDVQIPEWFGLKQFLPARFDPTQGIKRLRPNDHPFVSVRKIMSG